MEENQELPVSESQEVSVPETQEVEQKTTPELRPWGMEISQFRMFMHLSQFGSMIVPLGGIVLPIVMWSTYKDQDAEIDEHGKNIINWIISSTIYLFASIILCFVLIGIPLLFGIIICSIVFTIQGAIKANNGEVYKYPLSIKFIK